MEKDIIKVSKLNDASIALFESFKNRKRFRRRTNVNLLHQELVAKFGKIEESQLIETFKMLQDMEFGSLVVGRRNNPTRFIWNYSLKDLAKAAKGELKMDEINAIPPLDSRYKRKPSKPEPTKEVEVPVTPTFSDKKIIVIRDNSVIELNLSPEKDKLLSELLKIVSL